MVLFSIFGLCRLEGLVVVVCACFWCGVLHDDFMRGELRFWCVRFGRLLVDWGCGFVLVCILSLWVCWVVVTFCTFPFCVRVVLFAFLLWFLVVMLGCGLADWILLGVGLASGVWGSLMSLVFWIIYWCHERVFEEECSLVVGAVSFLGLLGGQGLVAIFASASVALLPLFRGPVLTPLSSPAASARSHLDCPCPSLPQGTLLSDHFCAHPSFCVHFPPAPLMRYYVFRPARGDRAYAVITRLSRNRPASRDPSPSFLWFRSAMLSFAKQSKRTFICGWILCQCHQRWCAARQPSAIVGLPEKSLWDIEILAIRRSQTATYANKIFSGPYTHCYGAAGGLVLRLRTLAKKARNIVLDGHRWKDALATASANFNQWKFV